MKIKRSTFELLKFALSVLLYAVAVYLIMRWFPDMFWKIIFIVGLLLYANNLHVFNVLHTFDKEYEDMWDIDEDE